MVTCDDDAPFVFPYSFKIVVIFRFLLNGADDVSQLLFPDVLSSGGCPIFTICNAFTTLWNWLQTSILANLIDVFFHLSQVIPGRMEFLTRVLIDGINHDMVVEVICIGVSNNGELESLSSEKLSGCFDA